MTDHRDTRRWFLRWGGDDQPYVEVIKDEWLQAEHDAGFRGGRMIEPSTEGFGAGIGGTLIHGVITYSKEGVPPGAMELTTRGPEVTYEWATRIFAHDGYDQDDMPSFANHQMSEEERAHDRARWINEKTGRVIATPIRRRIETYGWEEVSGE